MKLRLTPSLAWTVALGLLAAYEFYALEDDIPGDTLSEVVWKVAAKRPLVPFLAGCLMGHFFWQDSDRPE